MKIARIALLLILSMLILLCFTGCRCVPSSVDWHFYSYKSQMTFIGGVTRELGFSDASVVYPFAGAKSNISIDFDKNGKVVFTTCEGETLYGTYTYEHVKSNYTNFTITLDNGEIIEGASVKSYKESMLSLTYKDIVYNFSDQNNRNYTTLESVVKRVSMGDHESLHKVNVEYIDGAYSVRFSEYIYYPIKEDTAVYAIQIHRDESYTILDSIRTGEALAAYNDSANYIVIYYVD